LSKYVHYARSANAFDENKKDFQRVAAAVGEGAQVVATLHAHLSPRA
jgi:hypothetical protein